MSTNRHHLALFARFPSPGTCKTRLIPSLGQEGAYTFALAALSDTLHHFAALPVQKTFFYAPAISGSDDVASFLARESLQYSWDAYPQIPGGDSSTTTSTSTTSSSVPDLGSRLQAALEYIQTLVLGSTTSITDDEEFTSLPSASSVAVTFIGMDCFELTPSAILDSMSLVSATAATTAHMLPARDGGYVLLTVPLTCASGVFDRIQWSCDQTARMQIKRLEEAGLSCVVGEMLDDVDDPHDLERMWEVRGQKKLDAYPRVMRFLDTVMIERDPEP